MLKKIINHWLFPSIFCSILLIAANFSILQRLYTTDEIWNIQLINKNFSEIIKEVANDVHPPLHFLIQKIFSVFIGDSELAMHLLSLFFGILAVFIFSRLLNEIFPKNEKINFLGTIIFTLSPLFLSQIVFARYYSFLYLITILSYYLFIKILTKADKKNLFLLALINLIGLYTNYLMLIFIGMQFFSYFLFNKKAILKNIFWGTLIPIIGFSPWLIILQKQLANGENRYLNDLNLSFILKGGYVVFNEFLGPLIFVQNYTLIIPILSAFALLSLFILIRIRQCSKIIGMLLIHGLICGAIMIYTNLILPHYLLPLNFILIIFFIYGLTINKFKIAIFSLIMILWLPSLYNFFTKQDWHITNAIDNWEEIIDYAKKNPQCLKIIWDNSDILNYYFQKEKIANFVINEEINNFKQNEKCIIVIRTYLGKWLEGYKKFTKTIETFTATKYNLKKSIFLNEDLYYKEKNQILKNQIFYPQYRLELYHYEKP